jgi:hypothetical protein
MFPNHLLPARLPHTAARLVCQTSHTYNSIITAMTSRPRHSRIQQRRPSATQVRMTEGRGTEAPLDLKVVSSRHFATPAPLCTHDAGVTETGAA